METKTHMPNEPTQTEKTKQ